VNARLRELDPDTNSNMARPTLKRETGGVRKMAPLDTSSLGLARRLLFYLSFDQLVILRTWRVTTRGFQRLGLQSLRPCATRRRRRGAARAFVKIPLGKNLRIPVCSPKIFPWRALNIRNLVHVRNDVSHVRARCRDRRDVGLELSHALGNCCNAAPRASATRRERSRFDLQMRGSGS
jgi:hypothetical protein